MSLTDIDSWQYKHVRVARKGNERDCGAMGVLKKSDTLIGGYVFTPIHKINKDCGVVFKKNEIAYIEPFLDDGEQFGHTHIRIQLAF